MGCARSTPVSSAVTSKTGPVVPARFENVQLRVFSQHPALRGQPFAVAINEPWSTYLVGATSSTVVPIYFEATDDAAKPFVVVHTHVHTLTRRHAQRHTYTRARQRIQTYARKKNTHTC